MPHTIHIDKWIKRSSEDFYMLFVRAWIPFNAWYHKEIRPVAGKRDRDCIDYIAHNSNTFKNKILSFLNGKDGESLQFQQELVDLPEWVNLDYSWYNCYALQVQDVSDGGTTAYPMLLLPRGSNTAGSGQPYCCPEAAIANQPFLYRRI